MPAKPTTTKDPLLQEQTRLVRAVEANLKVVTQDPEELRFRGSLLRKAAADLPLINPSLATRLYEAVCDVDFAQPEIVTLRKSLQAAIGTQLNLKEHRAAKA
ncbi:MAG: hypothetical protein U1E02_26640 [Hydrogenophaga sp.]|nr:hypothetical protein [Luteolibacter sp.]MDZ4127716.1 hypothetical protein [Hydrogenophaga sp.]